MEKDSLPEFISAEQAAELLHMHHRTVRRLLNSGELPGMRLGRQWRVSVAAVRRLIESGGRKPATSAQPAPGSSTGTTGD